MPPEVAAFSFPVSQDLGTFPWARPDGFDERWVGCLHDLVTANAAEAWQLLSSQDNLQFVEVVHQSGGGEQMAKNREVQFLGTGSDGRRDLLHRSGNTAAGCQQYATRPSCVPEDGVWARAEALVQQLAVDVVPLTCETVGESRHSRSSLAARTVGELRHSRSSLVVLPGTVRVVQVPGGFPLVRPPQQKLELAGWDGHYVSGVLLVRSSGQGHAGSSR